MKKLALTLAVLVVFATMSTPANAQTKKDSTFDSYEACDVALRSGDFSIYVPVDVSKKNVNPIDNITVFPVKLEADQCRLQHTMKGDKWVVQKGDTRMRARRDASGELVIFARDDCGNEDKTPVPPASDPAPQPVTTVAEEPVKKLENLPGDNITKIIENSFNTIHNHYDNVPTGEASAPPATDKYHGWCGIWTHTGCTAIAVVIIGGTVYIATQGNDNPGPIVHTDEPTSKARIAPKVGIVPPGFGRGSGGLYLGASIGW